MAELVLGVGTSHSPMVTMDGPDWLDWGRHSDHHHPMLYTEDGVNRTYDQQLALVEGHFDDRITDGVVDDGAARVQRAVDELHRAVTEARLDALIVVGDDQDEHLLADNLPPFLVYWGDTITNAGMDSLDDDVAPVVARFMPGYRETGPARDYPVATDLARHLIDVALDQGFDLATSNRLPNPDRQMGHAFAFPLRRIVRGAVPIVPIMVNTYNPPAQPRARRCRQFGRMLRAAVDTYPTDARIGVLASGGLSHFLVLEDLDRRVLAALERHDLDELCAIPEPTFVAGTSEIKNWITTAAMCDDKRFVTVDYVPGYRTPAGTGTGLAFGLWR